MHERTYIYFEKGGLKILQSGGGQEGGIILKGGRINTLYEL